MIDRRSGDVVLKLIVDRSFMGEKEGSRRSPWHFPTYRGGYLGMDTERGIGKEMAASYYEHSTWPGEVTSTVRIVIIDPFCSEFAH
jgi:hypothetical protein